jgi:hypothetical protein
MDVNEKVRDIERNNNILIDDHYYDDSDDDYNDDDGRIVPEYIHMNNTKITSALTVKAIKCKLQFNLQ